MGVPQQKLFTTQSHFSSHLIDDNQNYMLDPSVNSISKFYEHSKIFITGATGFVGKALVEKLLKSCPKIDAIFLLMRPKRGVPVELRLKELFKNSVFNRIRETDPDAFEKVKAIPGDVGLPNLGLSDEDRNFLIENINIVFHSAATVKFNEDLKTAIILNTLGTKRLLELCEKMMHLKSCVHVSTAYSNSDKQTVNEQVYAPTYDAYAMINLIENLPSDIIEAISPKLVGNHPNTYTFAKALAEQLVMEHSGTVPTAIVRPSIITAAWKEPYPGWVDNVSGITGILMECGRGTIKTIICDDKCRMDLVPVDIVVNTLITSAWHTVAYRSNSMRVYNCTSGTDNPVTWKQFGEYTLKHSVIWPSKYVTWYPGFTYRTSRRIHDLCTLLYHNIPSTILDIFLYCTGKKPMMLKISKKFNQALIAGSFFSTNEWIFGSSTFKSLRKSVEFAQDGKEFSVDMTEESGFDWDEYIGEFLKGIRLYVLKDDLSSLPNALNKLNRLYWFQRIFQAITFYIFLRIVSSYF
ncbi:putative fatty acyl-CoA reductase CG5065 [Anthonomus grandis grandis]|uniref:putative fatty acyl-CoA reductase CG5065 n=1 Tax=Anthonomus grandis grandis TaxID=2921223 RepID=UPI002166B8A3|nr:putative fatty acyl-CoA reductase CG5065 [Anthonomus grandis grandis]